MLRIPIEYLNAARIRCVPTIAPETGRYTGSSHQGGDWLRF
jgi:hypothetical protein